MSAARLPEGIRGAARGAQEPPANPERARPDSGAGLPRDRWCIRFLNGTMRGRSIGLRPGANTVGSSPDCDVLLPDTEVSGRHLVLTAGEVAMTLQRLDDAAVELNGAPMTAERRSLAAGDIVSLGHIDFQIDREYLDPDDAAAQDSMFPGQDADFADEAVAPARRLASRAPLLAGFAVLLCAVAAAGVLWQGTRDKHGAPAMGVDLASLGQVLADFPEVHARTPDAAGQVQISGFVESGSRRQALMRALQPFGAQVRLDAIAIDAVIDDARQFVADPGLAFSYRGGGRLQVTGATDLEQTHDRVLRLGRDLYPLVIVEDKARYQPAPVAKASPAPASDWLSQLPAKVVSVTLDADGTRSIQLANGDRYFEGAMLRSGVAMGNLNPEALLPNVEGPQAP